MIGLPAATGEEVDQLHSGVVLLRVPLIDDVIQVGATGTPATGSIEVLKTPTALVVRRSAGIPLQAAIIHQRPGGVVVRMPVFTEPVERLVLRRVLDFEGAQRWLAGPGGRIRCRQDLAQLIRTIAAFAAAKQRRTCCEPGSAVSA